MYQLSTSRLTTPRRGLRAGLALLFALLAGTLVPASANAAKPLPGSPKKPVVSLEIDDVPILIKGEANMSNRCTGGPIYCHTYISIMIRTGKKYEVYAWEDISNLTGLQDIEVTPAAGKNYYRTAVHDFATFLTPGECGSKYKRVNGIRYKRWSCDGTFTTYLKIFSSRTKRITAPV